MHDNPAQLSAVEAARAIRDGSLKSADLVAACLAEVDSSEETVQAWAYLDRDYARAQAARIDAMRQAGVEIGPLGGVPVGIKDIIDVQGLPCEMGTAIHAGRKATDDAHVVQLLREAGAVIMGKTVTTELAVFTPGKTRNPHNPAHTPGGSSSGSAAAVAAGHVPLALGTQTNGSVIRPAAYCGVYGFKPTFGSVSRRGIKTQSNLLDQVGFFARSVGDLARVAEATSAFDPRDGAMPLAPRPRLGQLCAAAPPVEPSLAFVRTPVWDKADAAAQQAFEELAAALGEDIITGFDLPDSYAEAWAHQRRIHVADLAKNYASEYATGKLSERLAALIEEGQRVLAVDYARANEWRAVLYGGLDEVFERFDAILTPAATGAAPPGLESTGDPAFCTLWTYLGMPALSLPLLSDAAGLPIGVQLVGPRGDDGRLLRTANWLVQRLAEITE